MDTALRYRLDVIITLLFLVVLVENYRATGYFGAAFIAIVTIVLVVFAPE